MQNSQHRRKPSENSSVVFEMTDEELESFSGGVLSISLMNSGTSTVILAGSHLKAKTE